MKKQISWAMLIIAMVVSLNVMAAKYKVEGSVSLNTATKSQLVMIPGIGESKADAILAERQKKAFTNTKDLLVIRGIGEKMLAKITPYVNTKGQTTIKRVKVQ